MDYAKAPAASQELAAGKKQRFPSLLLETGSARLPVKERLEAFFFRNGYFDIYDSALGLPGLKPRYPTTVSTPEDLSREGRKKAVAALQMMVEAGEITLRGLVDGKYILPQAPIGYWEEKKNARFWVDLVVDHKMDMLRLPPRAMAVVERFRKGESLNFFENLIYLEAKREAVCSLCEQDFKDSGLHGMFQDRYGAKIFSLISELYPKFGINIWETSSKGLTKYFSSKKNQVKGTRWLVKQFRKKFRDFTEDEAYAYELHENYRSMMSNRDWRFWQKIDPAWEKDPLTLQTADYYKHGLKRLIEQIPLPQVPNAAIPAFEERGYTMESFRKAKSSHMKECLLAKKKQGKKLPTAAKRPPGHAYEEPPAIEQQVAAGRKELIQAAYRFIDKYKARMLSEKLGCFCITLEAHYGASKPIALSNRQGAPERGKAPRLAIKADLVAGRYAYRFYPADGPSLGGAFQPHRLSAVLEWLGKQPLRGKAAGMPSCEEPA
ncbi:MAG: hypothetical protein WC861_02555 [Candidatus Micrarchaeia archaeon]|jgi:hypothetical protein